LERVEGPAGGEERSGGLLRRGEIHGAWPIPKKTFHGKSHQSQKRIIRRTSGLTPEKKSTDNEKKRRGKRSNNI